MSLLMEALKQQSSPQQPTQAARSAFGWQGLALVLLVLVGLLTGFLLAQWLQQPKVEMAAAPVQAAPLPAGPGLILTDLLATPVNSDVPSSDEEQLLVSAERKQQAEHALEQFAAATEQLGEPFEAEQPMQEADLSAPVDDQPGRAPELTTADVSQELKDKFQFALESSANAGRRPKINESAAPARDIRSLDDLLQRQIPPIRFEAHVYASEPKQRWVKANGKDLQEGQWVTANVQIIEITSQYVLLQTGRQLFSMEALSEWSYRLKN